MKNSLRPRIPSRLSDSVQRQLNMYALAASAAGVSALALAQTAEGEIVYTRVHQVIEKNEKYNLAMNHKTTNFVISNFYCNGSEGCTSTAWARLRVTSAASGNGVVTARGLASALNRGARISEGRTFFGRGVMADQAVNWYTEWTSGYWINVTDRYLGLKFKINGKFHYGWARLKVKVGPPGSPEIVATLTGYAYETIPNKAIIAGKECGEDDRADQPATLGKLALGRK